MKLLQIAKFELADAVP